MKRIIFSIILISLLIYPIYKLVSVSPNGNKLSAYSFHTSLSLSNSVLGDIVYLPNSTFDENQVIVMVKNLEKINRDILKLAEQQNIKIVLFQGSLTEQSGLSRLKNKKPRGYTETDPTWDSVPGMSDKRVVYAKIGHSEYGKGHSSISLELHEIAHALDRYVFNNVRNDLMFKSIWENESNRLFPANEYYFNYPEEFFAEAFAMYYYNASTHKQLIEKAPATFSYIHTLEEQAAKQVK